MPRLFNPVKVLRGVRDRRALLRLMPKESVCAEIGVWKGDFTRQILNTVRPRKLHLIDPWEFFDSAEYGRAWYGGGRKLGQSGMDRIHEQVRKRFENEITDGTVHIHRAASAEAAAEFPDDYFDWVYIDGNHLYEFVMQDLESYAPKVKPGGFLAGDDYAEEGWWEGGVQKAVDAFVEQGRAERFHILGNQFVLRRA